MRTKDLPIFRFASKLVLFIHIPKTGGSSIECTLEKMGGSMALFNEAGIGYAKCTLQHMHARIMEASISKDFCDYVFAVVRDPKQRLTSEYNMRRAGAGMSYAEWVKDTFYRYEKNPYVYDNHIRPQVEFITSTTKVFRFEDGLATPIREVSELTGCSSQDLAHERKGAPYTPEENPEIDSLIYDFYQKDYEAFGYTRTNPSCVLPSGGPV